MDNVIEWLCRNKEFLVASMSAIIAIVALFQTHRQITLSNKQFLFEKRLDRYILSKGLIELYLISEGLLNYSDKSNDNPIVVDFPFLNLVNNTFLKDVGKVMKNPYSKTEKIKYLIKIEDIKKLSDEVKFLFKKKCGLYLSDFIMKYQNVLTELYKYRIVQYSMFNDKIPRSKKPLYVELQKEYGESTYRESLIKAVDELKKSYQLVIDTESMKKIEKMLKL